MVDFNENDDWIDEQLEQHEQEENEKKIAEYEEENWNEIVLERLDALPFGLIQDNDIYKSMMSFFEKGMDERRAITSNEQKIIFEKLTLLEKFVEEDKEKRRLEFEQREKEKTEDIKKLETAKNTQITLTEIQTEKDKALETEKLYFIDKFVRLAEKETFYNEVACKLAAHWVLSPILRDVRLYKDGTSYIDARLHVLHLQESQTGKNMLTRWAASIITEVEKENDPGVLSPPKYVVEKIGSSTSAGLLNRKIPIKGKITDEDRADCEANEYYSGKYKFITGAIEYADLIYFEEAAPIFMARGSEYTRDIPEILITCMEPSGTMSNIWRKKLKETDMRTIGNATLYLSTRPLEVKFYEAVSGFTQRTLFYPKHVDEKLSTNMMNESYIHLLGDKTGARELTEKEKELVAELRKIKFFLKSINYDITTKKEDRLDLSTYAMKRNEERVLKVNAVFSKSKKKLDVAHTLLRGDINLTYKLAAHSAAVRYSKYIERQDFEYAVSVINLLVDAQIEFIDEMIKEELREEIQKQDIKKFVKGILSSPIAKVKGVKRLAIRKLIEQEYDYSSSRANYFLTINSENNGFIRIDANGICWLAETISE